MAHDVHPNPRPPTAPPPDELTYMTLNVGGPDICKKRCAGMPTEIEQQQPVCVGLQEVRFRTGSNHMALMSQLLHTYVPMYHRTQAADVMMLIHISISPYVTMLPSRTPHPMAVRVELPGKLPFTIINQWNSCNALPHRLEAVGSGSLAIQYFYAWGQWAVGLLTMQCRIAWEHWAVQLLHCTARQIHKTG